MTITEYQSVLHHLECALGHLARVLALDPDLSSKPALTWRAADLLRDEIDCISNMIIYKQSCLNRKNSIEENLKTVQ